MRTYAVDTANWWLDKLTAKSATTSVTWDAAQHALPSGTANPLRTVSSSYVWNADRTLSTETVQAGVALQQRVTAYTYPSSNNYGLPTGVAVSADSDAEDANSVVTKAAYNSIGQRTSVSDPNQGGWGFAYNGLGEVLAQTDARGISTQLTYDVLGRPKTRTATVDVTGDNVADTVNDGWTYDAANAKGAPEVAQRTINGVLERSSTHFYDTLARPVLTYFAQQTGTGIQGYNQGTKYDSYYGRPVGQEYPNGEAVQVLYSSYGDAIAEKEPVSGVEYRRSTGVNARGQATQEVFGNGVTLTPTYQVQTGQLTGLTYSNTGGTLRQLGYGYDVFGNLKRQSLGGGASREDYSYDQLHRLVQSIRSGAASGTVSYGFDAVGNLTKKSDFSSNTANAYGYTGGSCGGGANAVKSVALAAGGTRTYCYDANGNLTGDNAGLSLKYDHQNLPVVAQRGALRDDFRYGPDGMRTRSWGSDGARVYLPGYEHRTDTGETKVYIGDYAVISRTGATRKVEYLLKDRLGSVDAVANSSGAVTETRGYDAFGKPRSGTWNDLNPAKIASTAVTPKGFTQHEHLNELQLIHMNGRMYDYNVGRFTGVDPFIQFPLNSQSLNPYSYILNNPLSGTDPTGYTSCNANGNATDCANAAGPGGEAKVYKQDAGSRIKTTVGSVKNNGDGSATFTNNAGQSKTLGGGNGSSGGQSAMSVQITGSGGSGNAPASPASIGSPATNSTERHSLSQKLDAKYGISRSSPMSADAEGKLNPFSSLKVSQQYVSEQGEGLASFLYRLGDGWSDLVDKTGYEYRTHIGFDAKTSTFAIRLSTDRLPHASGLTVYKLSSQYLVIDNAHNHGIDNKVRISNDGYRRLTSMSKNVKNPDRFLNEYRDPYVSGSVSASYYPGGDRNKFSRLDYAETSQGWLLGGSGQFLHRTGNSVDHEIK